MTLRLFTFPLWLCLIATLLACAAPGMAPTGNDANSGGMDHDMSTMGTATTAPTTDTMAGMDHDMMPGMTGDDMQGMDATITELEGLTGAEFEIAFLDAMIPHHQSAIDMAQIALERGQREEVKTLAQAIITAQEAEIETMTTWLNDWHGQAPSGEDHGMMMPTSMETLRTIAAEDFDLAFVNAMIPHHQAALQMAELVAERTDRAELVTLADEIITSQQAEVDQMNTWAAEWGGGASLPSPHAAQLDSPVRRLK